MVHFLLMPLGFIAATEYREKFAALGNSHV